MNNTLEDRLLVLQVKAKYSSISIGEIAYVLSGKGRYLILILLSLPFCQPIQIPGLSIPFGLVIAIMGLRIALGKHLWLPKGLLKKRIPSDTLKKITDKALALMNKLKKWIHPRYEWVFKTPIMQVVNGLIIALLGIFLALPLPIPLSNLSPSWSIFLIALGTLESDGLCVLLGYILTLLTIIFFLLMLLPIKHYLF